MKLLIAIASLILGVSSAHASTACTEADFQNASSQQVQVNVQGMSYTPRCLTVRAGTQVSFDASTRHPLQGVGTNNPLFDEFGGAVNSRTVQFNEAGDFAYFCVAHGDATGRGMAGVIRVVR